MATAKKETVQSVRLTDQMRRDMVQALVLHATQGRSKASAALYNKLALRLYNARYSVADRKKMAALPKGWLPEASSIVVNIGGQRQGFAFGPWDVKPVITKRVPHGHHDEYGQRAAYVLEPRSELGSAALALMNESKKLGDEIDALRAKARAVLASAVTTTQLVAAWPEAAQFCPKHVPRLLPVVRREELNAAFGLKQAAA